MLQIEMRICDNVRNLRLAKGWTQKELGERVNKESGARWDRTTIATIENMIRSVSLVDGFFLSKALGVTVMEILS